MKASDTPANTEKAQSEKAAASKMSPRYWASRMFKPTYQRDGERLEVSEFYVQLQHSGRRQKVALKTNSREEASRNAARLYAAIRSKGWQAALREFQPDREAAPQSLITVGDLLKQVRPVLAVRERSFSNYSYAMRKIAREATGDCEESKSRFDPVNCPWRADADRVKLSAVTPAKVTAWKSAFIARAGVDELAKRRARRSVNSYLRNAKALFSKKAIRELKAVGVALPSPLPFDGVEIEAKKHVGSTRYVSTLDAPRLLRAAKDELREADPDAYGVILLALGAGLRRGEIDALQWTQVDFEKREISVVSANGFTAKTEESQGRIFADDGLLAELKAIKRDGPTLYVIEPATTRAKDRAGQYYRSEAALDRVTQWLRKKGILADKPIHTLRKEFGSLICEQGGIHAASRQLRHADLKTTSDYYADHRTRTVVAIGDMLARKAKR